MKSLGSYLNEGNIIDQLRYFIIPNFGESEYDNLKKANPIAMLDGIMYFSITTSQKPENTSPTKLYKNHLGWISEYQKT